MVSGSSLVSVVVLICLGPTYKEVSLKGKKRNNCPSGYNCTYGLVQAATNLNRHNSGKVTQKCTP